MESSKHRSLAPHFTRGYGPTTTLWVLAVASYGLGDVLTTVIGLSTGHLVEASPFVIPMIERHGFAALVGLKMLVFSITGAFWWATPYPHSIGVPLGLSIVGVLITGWNTYLILIFGL